MRRACRPWNLSQETGAARKPSPPPHQEQTPLAFVAILSYSKSGPLVPKFHTRDIHVRSDFREDNFHTGIMHTDYVMILGEFYFIASRLSHNPHPVHLVELELSAIRNGETDLSHSTIHVCTDPS
jgi:hypothetical protein